MSKSRLAFGDYVICSKMFVDIVKVNISEMLTTKLKEDIGM